MVRIRRHSKEAEVALVTFVGTEWELCLHGLCVRGGESVVD